ncbi:MAG: TonB-dependent receptor [Saprospiraceae bacterium]
MRVYLITFLFLLSITSLFSQQGSSDIADSLSIQNILVTHSKVPIQVRNAAKPIQIITAKAIKQSAGSDIAQILNDVSGIDVIGSLSNPGKDKSVFIRGASGEYTVVLLNGQPILDPSGIGGVIDLRSIPVGSIQRIEILKGSQSTLYGSDAIAGVINIITHQDQDKNAFSIIGQAAIGSNNTTKGNAGMSGHHSSLDYRLGLSYSRSDGISEALSLNDIDKFDADSFDRFGINAGLGYTITNAIKLDAFWQYSDYEGKTDAGSFSDSRKSIYRTDLNNLGLALTYDKDTWNGAIKYTHTATDRNFISDFGTFPFSGRFDNTDAWISKKMNDHAQLIVGLNLQNHQMLDDFTVIPDPKETIVSPYASLLLNLAENINAEVGIRYNDHSKFGENTNYSLALSYRITDNLKTFINYSTGFKAPNLFQLYGAFGANPELNPQKSKSFEIGLQAPLINGIINPQITFFSRKVTDVIVFTTGYMNQDQQNDMGVELEAGLRLGKNILLQLQYAFLDGNVITKDFSGTTLKVNNLYRRPKHNFSIKGFFTPNDKLSFNLGIKSIGSRSDLFFNPANGFAQEEVKLDSYFYVTLQGDYRFDETMGLFVDIKNLTNSNFQEVYGFTTLGANISFGVRLKFAE